MRLIPVWLRFVSLFSVVALGCGGPVDEPPVHYEATSAALYGDLSGNELARAIRIDAKHNALGLKRARTLIFTKIDNKAGEVEDVYTRRVLRTGNVPPTTDMNIEHTWPLSRGTSSSTFSSDMHHLYPCDSKANSTRANHPFGMVTSSTWEKGGSKLGSDYNGGEPVFEPPVEHRGNVARSLMYISVVYSLKIAAEEEAVLRAWDKEDPVDQNERDREAAIAGYQKNRNPFVIDSTLPERIKDF